MCQLGVWRDLQDTGFSQPFSQVKIKGGCVGRLALTSMSGELGLSSSSSTFSRPHSQLVNWFQDLFCGELYSCFPSLSGLRPLSWELFSVGTEIRILFTNKAVSTPWWLIRQQAGGWDRRVAENLRPTWAIDRTCPHPIPPQQKRRHQSAAYRSGTWGWPCFIQFCSKDVPSPKLT